MRVITPLRIEPQVQTSEVVSVNKREDCGDVGMDAIPSLLKQEKEVAGVDERD